MGKAIFCQGIHCHNRGECLHNARYLVASAADRSRAIAHCANQKHFERKALDHPQMNFNDLAIEGKEDAQ